jgi:hypothetical protein
MMFPYINDVNEGRLFDSLAINLYDLYAEVRTDTDGYFKQSDLISEVRSAKWNPAIREGEFERAYPDAMLLSNTCDISADNPRTVNTKQSIFAPVINFREYLHE